MSWTKQGTCFSHDTNIFFDIYENNPKVRNVIDDMCSSCPVRRTCFATAVSNKEWGVWGGVYLEDGKISAEFNNHKTNIDWQKTWQSLTMEE